MSFVSLGKLNNTICVPISRFFSRIMSQSFPNNETVIVNLINSIKLMFILIFSYNILRSKLGLKMHSFFPEKNLYFTTSKNSHFITKC